MSNFPTGSTTGAPIDLTSTTAQARSQALAADAAAELTAADSGQLLILEPDAGAIGQALPAVNAQAVGFEITILNVGALAVNVTSATDNFNGAPGPVAIAAGAASRFVAVQFNDDSFGYAVL